MSFLADTASLYASGELYARAAPESVQGRAAAVAGAVESTAFIVGGLALYLNLPQTKSIARRVGCRDGRDLMINSGFLRLESKRPPTRTHVIAGILFALYPLCWWLGWDHGRRARPRGSS